MQLLHQGGFCLGQLPGWLWLLERWWLPWLPLPAQFHGEREPASPVLPLQELALPSLCGRDARREMREGFSMSRPLPWPAHLLADAP